jgi:Fe-S cluster biogenesis protein NfuA
VAPRAEGRIFPGAEVMLMALDPGFRMHAERTPNPNSIKWVLGSPLVEGGASAFFDASPGQDVSPLATRLFGVPGVTGVFLGSNFLTVTKGDDVEWTDIAQPVVEAVKAHVETGEAALGLGFVARAATSGGEIEERIKRLLDEEIRPAVAMDGGDVVFAGYHAGRVELYMQGSCSGCPSSRATLKLGIEARLREEIPEVTEVVAL